MVCSGGTSDPFPHLVLEAQMNGKTSRADGDCDTIYNDNGQTPDPKIRLSPGDGYPWWADASKDPTGYWTISQVEENKCYHFTICGGRRDSWTDPTCSSNKVNQDDESVWWAGMGKYSTNNICELPYVVGNVNIASQCALITKFPHKIGHEAHFDERVVVP